MMNKFTLVAAMATVSVMAWAKPDWPTEFKMTFDLNGGDPIAKGSFVCPTMNAPESDGPIGKITKIRVIRGCSDVQEMDLPVFESTEEYEPGQLVEFEDEEKGWEYGYTYTYNVRVWDENGIEGYGRSFYLFAGVKPGKPELSVELGDNGSLPVKLTVVAPTTVEDGGELTVPLTKLRVIEYITYQKEREIKVINDPVPGKSYEIVDNEAEEGKEYSYRAYASCEYGTSEMGWVSAYVGQDVPGNPSNLMLTENEDGSVTLTWTAPEKGKNGGYFDPASVRYKVIRHGDAPKDLAEDLTECTYTDPLEGLTGPTAIKYEVVAYNTMGDGDYAMSSELLKGPAYQLPFEENFNSPASSYGLDWDNKWTTEPSYGDWTIDDYSFSHWITGVGDGKSLNDGEDEGFAFIYYGSRGNSDSMISSAIDFKKATYPVMYFYHAGTAGDPSELRVSVKVDNENIDLVTLVPGELQEGDDVKWKRYTLPLEEVAGKEASLIFTSYIPEDAEDFDGVCLDRIIVADYPGIDKVSVTETADGLEVSWMAPKNSYSEEPESYDVVVDDAEPVNVTEPKHVIKATRAGEAETHKVSVRANYGDIQGKFSPAFDAVPGGSLSGISAIGGNANMKVEYFDVNGLPVVKAMKGSTIIRRTVSENGSVKVEKIIVKE